MGAEDVEEGLSHEIGCRADRTPAGQDKLPSPGFPSDYPYHLLYIFLDQDLGNLNGVEGGAFPEVVGHDPHVDAVVD